MNWKRLFVMVVTVSVGAFGCQRDVDWPGFRVTTEETPGESGAEGTYSSPDSRCPLAEMVYITGSGGPFTWGSEWDAEVSADLYNWMFEYEYPEVKAYCILQAPFPAKPGSSYFINDDNDIHGNSYGDTRSVRDSEVLDELGMRLPTFTEAAWFQEQIEGDGINLDQCTMEKVGADGMFAHRECTTSLGVEIGPYAFWTIYDADARTAHTASIEELGPRQPHNYLGLPNAALEFLLSGWGGGAVCSTRSPFCVHQHVVQYGALWDGPMDGDQPYDPPGDPYQTLPGNCWQDDMYMLVTSPGAPDQDLQEKFDKVVQRYNASDHNKAVLWDPDVGL